MKSLPIFSLTLIAWLATSCGSGPCLLRAEQPAATSARGTLKPPPTDELSPESAAAKAVLDQARQRLLSYQSIQAKLVETVALDAKRFTVQGAYLQGRGADLKLRLEFHVRLGETEGSLLEVCDGQVLWTQHHIGSETHITRRNVREILDLAAKSGLDANLQIVELGFGGLPGLFASIDKSIRLDQHKTETSEGRDWVVLEGGWKPELRKFWQNHQPKGQSSLSDHVPARVRLYLDAESLFPRRILYLGRNAEQSLRPMVSLDFSEVRTNQPLPADVFKFTPPDGVFPMDLTQDFLERIKRRQN